MPYSRFTDGQDEYGSFETFFVPSNRSHATDNDDLEAGWYWWACFPGCLPDGEPSGPFNSEREAILDARSY